MEQTLEIPDNLDALPKWVGELLRENKQLKVDNATLSSKNSFLQEQINLLLHKRFGANTEKYRAEQSDLFNEAEAYAEESPQTEALIETTIAEAVESSPADSVLTDTSPVNPPAKRGRKALPQELPRVEIIHELPVDQRQCSEGHALVVIGEEVSEQLDIIPAKVQVLRHIRKKYACPCCQAEVKTAPLPPQPIPKSNASAGLLAYIVISQISGRLAALPAEQTVSAHWRTSASRDAGAMDDPLR